MKQTLNILLLGNSDREKALADKILASPRCGTLYSSFTPSAGAEDFPSDITDFSAIAAFCKAREVDMMVVGPAEPIVAGIRDFMNDYPGLEDMSVIAPAAQTARLEGSKEFAKDFMSEAGIPTARYMPVDIDTLDEGLSYIDSLPAPYVIKADGLAGGRGVWIIEEKAEAKDLLEDLVRGAMGETATKVLIEEFINGRECTLMAALDGKDFILLPAARDYKRLLDSDKGPNTPGMGSYSPVDYINEDFLGKVAKRIIIPTLRMLEERELEYQGFLYFGIIELDGEPILLEYNVRMGDPETEAVLPRIESDFVDLLEAIAEKRLDEYDLRVSEDCCVALKILSGRTPMMTVVAKADSIEEAAREAYQKAENLDIPGIYYRNDIAKPE